MHENKKRNLIKLRLKMGASVECGKILGIGALTNLAVQLLSSKELSKFFHPSLVRLGVVISVGVETKDKLVIRTL